MLGLLELQLIYHDYEPLRRVIDEAQPKCSRSCTVQQAAGAATGQTQHDKFVAHLYQAHRQYRCTCERPNKGNKAIEREIISSYQIAQSLGFNGDYRGWEHLLRIRE